MLPNPSGPGSGLASCLLRALPGAGLTAVAQALPFASCLAAAQANEDKCPARHVTPSTRLDADVLGAFRAGAVGWQTRVNAALRAWLASHGPEPMVKAATLAAGQGSDQTAVLAGRLIAVVRQLGANRQDPEPRI